MLWLVIPLVLISAVSLLVMRRRRTQAERKLRRDNQDMYPLW